MLRSLISLHDVMPETMDKVEEQITLIRRHQQGPLTLLVVPGKNWQPEQIARLRQWQQEDCELAGHGWTHSVRSIRNLKHWVHSRTISRRAAEHLSLNRKEILQLMRDCFTWFSQNDLASPRLYVPPAWALGPLSTKDLAGMPFKQIEVLSGLIDCASGKNKILNMVGYEADNRPRACFLKVFNAVNVKLVPRQPLRIGMHPYDLDYHLKDDLMKLLRQPMELLNYGSVSV